jgi:hypothetical protein
MHSMLHWYANSDHDIIIESVTYQPSPPIEISLFPSSVNLTPVTNSLCPVTLAKQRPLLNRRCVQKQDSIA